MNRESVLVGALAVLLVLGPAPEAVRADSDVDLSPASWDRGELDEYTDLNLISGKRKPRGMGREGMVVGTTGALAVRSGLEALRQGGSAMDAALVTALTQVTLAAGAWVSFAGILSLMHYDAASGRVTYLNGEFNTLLGEDNPLSIPGSGASGRTALVPGFMAAVEAAHRRYGALSFASLFGPAIYFAEQGFALDQDLAATMEFRRDVLHRLPATREIFFGTDGSLPRVGQAFRQPRLAETLRAVARDGAQHMYGGPWGERLVAAVNAEGGKMSLEDLWRYEALWRKSKRARFRGFRIHGPRSPGSGGTLAARTFKDLHKIDLPELGHYTASADALFRLMSATRKIYRHVPPLHHSDGVIAVDAAGNVVALLHSINTLAWGETGLFVDGVSIPDAAAQQQRRVLQAGPGNRLWTGIVPLIATRKGKPVAASSAIGNGLFEATVQHLVNVLDYGLDPWEAMAQPVFRSPVRTVDGIADQRVTRGDFPDAVLDAVRALGIPIVELPRLNFEGRGYWVGVSIDPAGGELVGAAPSDFNGLAEGL